MTQSKPLAPEEKGMLPQDKTIRRAVLVGLALAGSTFLFLALGIYLTITTGVWQSIAFSVWLLFAEVVLFVGISYIRRGQMNLGGWIILGANTIGATLASMLYVRLGYTAVAYELITSFFLISYVMPGNIRRPTIVASSVGLVITIAAEIINPAWRQTAQIILNLAPIITAILGIAFLVVVGYQVWITSMRNKMLVGFIGVTLVVTGAMAVYVYVSTSNILQRSLEQELTQHAQGTAEQITAVLNEQIDTLQALALNDVIEQTAKEINNSYTGDTNAIQSTLDARDKQWRAADAANNDNNPLVKEFITNDASNKLRQYQATFPGNAEVFFTDKYGGQAGSTNRTSDYLQSDEAWWQAAYNNGEGAVYVSEPEYDESAGALALVIALPIRSEETGEIVGILRTTYLASSLNPIISEVLGRTGETNLFVLTGDVVSRYDGEQYTQVDPAVFKEIQSAGIGLFELDYEGVPSVVLQIPVRSPEGNQVIDKLGWAVLFHQQQDEAFAPVNTQVRGVLIVVSIVVGLAILVALGISLLLVRPITQLTKTAEEVAAGNLSSRAQVTSSDEVGILASTFNSMTSQLQETLQGLEERVTARTRDLAIVAEVGTATATILESKRLLQEVVDLTKERFNLYHSHIYLLDEEGRNLVLTAGAGEPGRIMVAEGRSIPLDREQSLVARAARERQGVTVNDVTQEPDFLPNPLLPDTHSELAVPMIAGGNVIGVFDIQSEQVGRFTDSDINIQTTMAAQLATSIQNVRLFERSKKDAELQSLVNMIGNRIQRTTSIEETLRTAIRELGTAIGASRVKADITRNNNYTSGNN